MVASGVFLTRGENPEADLSGYRLYRGSSADFVPAAENRIGAPPGRLAIWTRATGAHFYKLSAIDEHENESDFAVLAPLATTSVGEAPIGSRWVALTPIRREVSGGPSRSRCPPPALPRSRSSTWPDVASDTRNLSALGPGRHHVALREAARLPSGVYMIRLTHGHGSREIKAVVAR